VGEQFAGTDDAAGLRFAIVVSRFKQPITEKLLEAAQRTLVDRGAADVDVAWVPGAFEIPQAARRLAETGRFDAIVCLGCVIRGETPHFDYLCAATAQGITEAAQATGVPMTFGVLTTNSAAEAIARAAKGSANKGWEAAMAAVALASVVRRFPRAPATETGA
jgi:6,7-dimethyl-8-ribityllumazine synthase